MTNSDRELRSLFSLFGSAASASLLLLVGVPVKKPRHRYLLLNKTMFGFVWIAFLVLQKSLGVQPEGLVNSTGLNINEQSSTVSYLNEATGTSKLSNIPIAANLESTEETSVGTRNNHLECNKDGDCTSQLYSSSASDTQSAVSPKITWSPAVSLSITSKDVDSHSTVPSPASGKFESEATVTNHPTTPDIYGTLNHNENELDSEVKYKGQHVMPVVNNTMKTTENPFDIVNVTISSFVENEDSLFSREASVFTSGPSKISEESTRLSTSLNDNSLEHLKISSPDDTHPNFTLATSDVEMSSFISSSQADAIHISDTTSPSIRTVSQLDDTGTKDSVHPLFRYSRNTISTNNFGKTTITDHSVLDAEAISSIQESELPFTTTIYPNSLKLNFRDNNFENLKSEESSSQPHFLNSTNTETSAGSILIDQSTVTMSKTTEDHVSIREGETVSSNTTHSTTTAQSLKEIHTTMQSETLPPDISQDVNGIQTSTLPSQNIGLTGPTVNGTTFKFTYTSPRHNSSTINPFLEPMSSENHKTVDEILNLTDTTSTTASHHIVHNTEVNDKDQEGTMDNHLFHFNEISLSKGTTLPSEEKSSSMYPTTSPDTLDEKKMFPGTTETGSSLNTTVEQSTLQSVRHSTLMGEQVTVSSILPMTKIEFTITPIMENTNSQPSSSVDLTSISLDGQPTSFSSVVQTISSMVDSTTLMSTVDQSTFSSSIDQISLNTPDQISSTANKISFHTQDQTSSTVDQPTSSSAVDQLPSSSSVDLSTSSSSVDHISPSSVDQTTSSFVNLTFFSSADQTSSTTDQLTPSTTVDQPTLSSAVDQLSVSTVDKSIFSGSVDQKSSSPVQQPISSSSVDPTTEVFISSPSVTSTEVKEALNTQVEDISPSLIPMSPSSSIPPKTSASIHVFPSMLLTSTIYSVPDEETTSAIPKLESLNVTNPPQTTKPSFDYTRIQISNIATETHREGKHIPFSTESTRRETVESSNEVILVTSTKESEMETTINLKEVIYNQLYYEDLTLNDKSNVISAVVQLPSQDMDNVDINIKISEVHTLLTHVLMKEFQNWTRDPFDEIGSQSSDMPFGKVTIFYILPTPKTKSSNITMTFIVHNQWRNETLPVNFVLSILNFYSADLKQAMNASSVNFYHGLLTEDSDLLPVIFEKYGVIVFSTALAVLGVVLFICIVIIFRKRNRRSVHYLANSKLQRNLQESVGIDLTPAVVILQDEKKILNGNSKMCDDEGWLVPIHEVPLAEDINMPKVQDTKL